MRTADDIRDALGRALATRPALLGLRHRLDVRSRARRRRVLQHETGLVPGTAGGFLVPDKQATAEDVAIAARLLAAHRRARGSAPDPPATDDRADVWTSITARQRPFAAILDRGDPAELGAYLCNVSRHDAAVGITQGDDEYRRLCIDAPYRAYVGTMAKDKLLSLAEAVGAHAVENPEQGVSARRMRSDPAEIVDRVSARLGIDLAPPDVDGGLLKIDTGRGLFGERDSNAIYTAHLLCATVREPASARVCEIGGGSGRVAYWSRRLGLTSYTLIDLPHVNVVQGYYALKSLPADEVALYGERPAHAPGARLQILPSHALGDLGDARYDLVLNQDSFPEMSAATVNDYLRWIARCCRGSLLSINHESKSAYGDGLEHVSVPELAGALGGYELVYRFPYWLRKGYVVERYRVAG